MWSAMTRKAIASSSCSEGETPSLPYIETGFAVNSGFLDGLPTAEAKVKMIDWLEAEGQIDRMGKRICYTSGKIRSDDKVIMTMTGVFNIMR